MHGQDFKNYEMLEDVPGVSVAFGKDYQKTFWLSTISQDLLVFYTNIYYLSNPETSKTVSLFVTFHSIFLIRNFPVFVYTCFEGEMKTKIYSLS